MKTLVSCDRNLSWFEQIEKLNTLIPLKYATNINSEALSESTPSELLIKYIDIGSVDSTGNISQIGEFTFKNSPSRARRKVQQGDTIVSTVRTYLKAIAYIDQNESSLIASTGFAVLSAVRNVICSRYLYYWMRSDFVVDEICARSVGVSYPATNAPEIGSISIPALPMERQKSIAHFLDRKTAAIDTLVAKKQRLIQLLEEKRTALINQAVTKGLNPNSPMKNSGIPWIGEIPEHWEVLRLRHLISDKVADPYGSSLTKSMYVSTGYRVYGQQQVIPGNFTVGDYYISPEKFLEMQRYLVQPKDVLVTVMGTIGRVAVVPEEIETGIINPRLVKYVVRKKYILPYFFAWVFRSKSGESQLSEMAQGVTMDGLNLTVLSDLWMPIPLLDEQNNIVTYIDEITNKNNRLQHVVKKQIEKLQEYRRSLITAAVTGKLAISEVEPDV
jgi:type I restriction enzyme, S subunit